MGMNFNRPFGTWSVRTLLPTLKRWAIVVRSLRDGTRDVYLIGYNQALVIAISHRARHNVVTLLSCAPVRTQADKAVDNPPAAFSF